MRCLSNFRFHTFLTVVSLLLAVHPGAADDGTNTSPLSASLRPSASLNPEDVVRIQLEALRENDDEDRGIAVAFRFASPANKRSTGPLPRFISMIKNGPYSPMLRYRKIVYAPVRIEGDRAAQHVTLIGEQGVFDFVFLLSRQRRAPCEGCWMTDAVTLLPAAGQPV